MTNPVADGHDQPFASITTLVPDWQAPTSVTAFSTTRMGGVSLPPYDSLNLGLHVGDSAEHVVENRRRLEDSLALPASPVWLEQTHSADVAVVNTSSPASAPSADAAWTSQSKTVLVVLTADCLPVVITDAKGSELAVVHAGWRGLAAGILENALSHFSHNTSLYAWLGPAIGPQSFEVGEEVREAFVTRNPLHKSAFATTRRAGKFLANLYQLASTELSQTRAVAVSGGEYCTVRQPAWFHSHRRDGVNSGRLATVAWLD